MTKTADATKPIEEAIEQSKEQAVSEHRGLVDVLVRIAEALERAHPAKAEPMRLIDTTDGEPEEEE